MFVDRPAVVASFAPQRAAVMVLAVADFLLYRNGMYSDGISYLEIADRYKALDFNAAVNAYWSPLYSWVLALATSLLHSGSYFEVQVLHAVNLTALVLGWFAFESVGRIVGLGHRGRWLACAGFLWVMPGMVGVGLATPDLLAALFILLLAAAVLRARRRMPSTFEEATIGALVALAYFTKAAMLPIGVLYLATACVAARRLLGTALVTLALLITPWLLMLHAAYGGWTVGESGRLNYAWEVSGVTRSTHWQGEDFGPAIHPTRLVSANPMMVEYGNPITATYPPWYDPTYWYRGVNPEFSLLEQLRATATGLRKVSVWLLILPGLLPIFVLVRFRIPQTPDLALLAVPALGSLLLLSLVFIEPRYVAAQLALVGLVGAMVVDRVCLSRWGLRVVAIGAATTCGISLLVTILGSGLTIAGFLTGRANGNPHWHLAAELRSLGVSEGDRIGYIGLPISAYWARLAHARIVAEVPILYARNADVNQTLRLDDGHIQAFWKSSSTEQARLLSQFEQLGVKWVVADVVPTWADTTGWTRLESVVRVDRVSTSTYVRALPLR